MERREYARPNRHHTKNVSILCAHEKYLAEDDVKEKEMWSMKKRKKSHGDEITNEQGENPSILPAEQWDKVDEEAATEELNRLD